MKTIDDNDDDEDDDDDDDNDDDDDVDDDDNDDGGDRANRCMIDRLLRRHMQNLLRFRRCAAVTTAFSDAPQSVDN